METRVAIQTRRSVRSFKKKKPDWRNIIEAIHSAQYAPMAGGNFSLRILIIDDSTKIEKIADFSEQKFIEEAKYLAIFISDPKVTKIPYGERGETYLKQQAGAAMQNFNLHLTDIGLSTCWIGHFNEEEIKRLLKIPKEMNIEAIFPIGYPKENLKIRQKKPPYNYLYFNEWENKRMKNEPDIQGRMTGFKS